MKKYKYINLHNNYDLKLNNIYDGYLYKKGWIKIGNVLYRENCFAEEE